MIQYQPWHRQHILKFSWYVWSYCCHSCTKPAMYFDIISNLAFIIPWYRWIPLSWFHRCYSDRTMLKICCKYENEKKKYVNFQMKIPIPSTDSQSAICGRLQICIKCHILRQSRLFSPSQFTLNFQLNFRNWKYVNFAH